MSLEQVGTIAGALGCIVLLLLIIYLGMLIMKSLGKQQPLKVLVKNVVDKPTPDPLKAAVQEALKLPPEAEPGPEMIYPEPEADGKIPLVCDKCQTAYRVYPNRDYYTCTNCQEKMFLPKITAKPKNGKDKAAPKKFGPVLPI